MDTPPSYSPGLEGVFAGQSAISRIDIERNLLIIRGYDLLALTENASYEEVAFLLLYGELPTRAELERFHSDISTQRQLPTAVIDLLRNVPASAQPMAVLRTAVSALALHDEEARDNSHEANVRKAVRLLARIATAVATAHRFSIGGQPLAPRDDLGQAANLLYMLRGTEPAAYEEQALNISLILYAEHGYNASAFAARVTASTLSDIYAAIATGIGTLAGPLHGGANEEAMHMLLEIGAVDGAEEWVLDALVKKKKIMGFGHREYKNGDSRVPSMKKVAREVATAVGDNRWVDLAEVVEATMGREKGIFPNVDFPCSYTYYMMGIPIPLYTPIFVSSRVAGWAAHVIEQHDGNRLIRPNHIYTGEEGKAFKAIDER